MVKMKIVEVVALGREDCPDVVVKATAPMDPAFAIRLEAGILASLDHERFYTRVINAEPEKEAA